ncbi:MAG: decaprenyl-phosphate phosphoribosyltransferase [Patescibacteria group bacterium]
MKKKLLNILRLLRPRQWSKNIAVFAAITFSGRLFELDLFLTVCYAMLIFCAISSAIYVINDLFDIKKDKLHPFKRFRPLAHGDVSKSEAIVIATILIVVGLTASYFINLSFFFIALIYLFLQLSYTLSFKHITVLDVLALAGGYILRVYAGEVVSEFHISVWLLLTTISLSLFLVVAKRRSELTLISQYTSAQIAATRKTLSHYSERLLDVYAAMFATSTFLSYALFTFLVDPKNTNPGSGELINTLFQINLDKKWLMLTIVPVVYGLMRYLQDVYEKHEGESPERVVLSDKPLLAAVILWGVLVVTIIYFVN